MKTRSNQHPSKKYYKTSQIKQSTSLFKKIDCDSLNIIFEDESSIVDFINIHINTLEVPNEVYVNNIDKPNLSDLEKIKNNKIKTFIQLMISVNENQGLKINTDESLTDNFVSHLLNKLEFGEYPFTLNLKPKYFFKVGDTKISSEFDFSVNKNREVVIVEEDKHTKNIEPGEQWGEFQLAGEFIAAMYNNYKQDPDNYNPIIYGVKVVGLIFNFYKAQISEEYIISLSQDFPIENVKIYRYPEQGSSKKLKGLDYNLSEDRKIIIDILWKIKNFLTKMSDNDYKPPGDSIDVWKATSTWRPVQLEILKVKYEDSELDKIINYDEDHLEYFFDYNKVLLPNIDIFENYNENNIPREQRIFFRRLKQLTFFVDEPPVDSITYDLLTNLGFEENKLHFRMKPNFKLSWNNLEIGSEPDFGVFTKNDRIFNEYLLVVENKPEKRNIYQNGECQLFGEMLLAALNNFSNIKKDFKIFGVIIKGVNVRFYNTIFKKEYLNFFVYDKIPNIYIKVYRYPSEEKLALSLNSFKERKQIINILTSIKKELESI